MKNIPIQRPTRGVWSYHFGKKWEEGFITGNGEIGSILYGYPAKPILTGNHHQLFLIGNDMYNLPDIGRYLPELQTIIENEGYQKGIEFYESKAMENGYKGLTMSDVYHPAFKIEFELLGVEPENDISFFNRSLDYEKGIVTQNYKLNSKQWINEEVFVSKDTNQIVFSFQSNEVFDLNLDIKDFEENLLKQKIFFKENNILQKNTYQNQSYYVTNLTWGSSKSYKKVSKNKIKFIDLTEIYFYVDITLNKTTKNLPSKEYKKVKEKHIKQHQTEYNNIEFNLVNNMERLRSIDHIFEEMQTTKKIPLVLYEKMYDASRYVIHSATGKNIPNLQGIWSGDFSPAWSGDYTFDTNVELAISSLNSLGLSEHFEGVFNKIEKYIPDFEENAKKYFGVRGYLVPAHASTTAKHVHWNSEWPLVFWFSGAGWLAHFYQEYYEYTKDKEFLKKRAIPFYENTVLFFEEIIQIKEGKALIRPSYSAENGMGDNATMDVAVLKEVISNLIKAYNIIEENVPQKYFKLYNYLPEYMINKEGSLKEWIDSDREENYNHRHFSQFYPIFQSKEITKENMKLWKAAQKAFDYKLSAWLLNSDRENSSSHGKIHAAMCAISFERPEDVATSINELYQNRAMYDSLVTSHYNNQEVFNVDANGALPKIYHDSLIYPETSNAVTLLKAVPNWLEKGSIKGFKLPNNITVNNFEWDISKGYLKLALRATENCSLKIYVSEKYSVSKRKFEDNNEITLKLKKDFINTISIEFS